MQYLTCAGTFRPAVRRKALAYDAGLVLGGSILLALSARVSFHVGPVPITAQTLAVVVLGALLGSRRGALAVLAYLAEGAGGLPVFAEGVGLPYMLGPTGGYLAGFVPAAWLAGYLAERGWDRRMGTTLLAMAAAHALIYVFGLAWLACWMAMSPDWQGLNHMFVVGLYPFLPGDVLKVCLATALLPSGWRLLGRIGLDSGMRKNNQ